MRTRRAVVAGCAALALGCGCSGGSGKAKPNPTTSEPTTTVAASTSTSTISASSTTTSTVVAAGPALETLVLATAPGGYPRKPDSAADTGPTNLDKAAFDDVLSSDAKAALVGAGFVQGYQRQWASSDGISQNFVFVYQFATPAGAQQYVEHWRAAIVGANAGSAPVPFSPTLIPGAIGLQASDKGGSSGVVLFAKGPYAVQAQSTGGPSIDQSLPANALALAQYQLLP